VCKY